MGIWFVDLYNNIKGLKDNANVYYNTLLNRYDDFLSMKKGVESKGFISDKALIEYVPKLQEISHTVEVVFTHWDNGVGKPYLAEFNKSLAIAENSKDENEVNNAKNICSKLFDEFVMYSEKWNSVFDDYDTAYNELYNQAVSLKFNEALERGKETLKAISDIPDKSFWYMLFHNPVLMLLGGLLIYWFFTSGTAKGVAIEGTKAGGKIAGGLVK